MTESLNFPTPENFRPDVPPKLRWVIQELVGKLHNLACSIKFYEPILADDPKVADLCRDHSRANRALMLRLQRYLDQQDALFLRASHGTDSDNPWSWQASPEQNESILKVHSACVAIGDRFKRAVQGYPSEERLDQTNLDAASAEGDFDALVRWCHQKDLWDEIKVRWHLGESDPDFDPEDDNIVHENHWSLISLLSDISPPPGGELTPEFDFNDSRPMTRVMPGDWRNSPHHYLFHDLVSHGYGEFSPLKPWVAARIGSVSVALTAICDFDLRVKPVSNAISQ